MCPGSSDNSPHPDAGHLRQQQQRLSPCVSKWSNNGTSPPLVTEGRWLNWSNPAAADWWVETYIGDALRKPELDGVYFDTGGGPPVDSVGISCGASCLPACHQISRDAQDAFERVLSLAKSLGKFITTQGAVSGGVTVAP
eukprot:COSAG06_NODE_14261_length_1173_cov_1.477654_2_plen_140_part_00